VKVVCVSIDDQANFRAPGLGSVGFCACFCATASLLASCAMSAPEARTTFLDSVDLIDMTDRMSQSFARNADIAARDSSSDRWIISIHRIENHTNEIIPEREKWLYVARLRALLDQSRLASERNIVWIIPPERWELLKAELGPAPASLRLAPTHELAGEFTALTTTSGSGRSDSYLAEYHLVDLGSGRLVWSDHWEVKRAIEGRTYD
jgi:hypothetical protein